MEDTETVLRFISADERDRFKGNFRKIVSLFAMMDSEAFLLQYFEEDEHC